MHNPYWDVVKDFPDGSLGRMYGPSRWSPSMYPQVNAMMEATQKGEPFDAAAFQSTPNRETLTHLYSFAIPSPAALTWAQTQLKGAAVLEIGAGTGYWASLLAQTGIDVLAYDKAPAVEGNNTYHKAISHHFVLEGDTAMAALHPERVLYLSWPPYGAPMGFDALSAYQGDTLLYCGEMSGGCCANEAFFEMLHSEWEEVDRCEEHVSWSGIHDELVLYRRR